MKEKVGKKKVEWRNNNSRGLNDVTIVDLNEKAIAVKTWMKK